MRCTRPKKLKGDFEEFAIPCGKCMACRIARAQEWSTRLGHELEYYNNVACFITLTYSDENLPEGGSLTMRDPQLFVKRLRRNLDVKIKTFYVGEYGGLNDRPHYHLIVFGWKPPMHDLYFTNKKRGRKYFASKTIDRIWKLGFNVVGVVERASISYVCSYCTKKLYGAKAVVAYGLKVHPFMRCSKGLGLQYALDNAEKIKNEKHLTEKGKKIGIPRYYQKKLEIDGVELMYDRMVRELKRAEEYDLPSERLYQEVIKSRLQIEKNLKAKEMLHDENLRNF